MVMPAIPMHELMAASNNTKRDPGQSYRIPSYPVRFFLGETGQDVEAPNGPSAERNPETTQRELDKEIANGNIIGPWTKPPLKGFRVTPRGIHGCRLLDK